MTEMSILEHTYTPAIYEGEEMELKPEFVIDDLARCEWYIKKVNNYKHDIETVNANAKKITERLQNELKSLEYLYLGQFRQEITKHIPVGKKSVKTLWGVAQFRTVKAGIEIIEKDSIPAEYLQEKITIVIDKDKLKADVIDNGLVIAGVELKPEREELYIQ